MNEIKLVVLLLILVFSVGNFLLEIDVDKNIVAVSRFLDGWEVAK